MEEKKMYAVGTVLYVNGSTKKVMIVARGAFVEQKEKKRYYDYGACSYPEGIVKDELFYFQEEDIQEVVAEGYCDEEEQHMKKSLSKMIPKMKERMGTV